MSQCWAGIQILAGVHHQWTKYQLRSTTEVIMGFPGEMYSYSPGSTPVDVGHVQLNSYPKYERSRREFSLYTYEYTPGAHHIDIVCSGVQIKCFLVGMSKVYT